MITLKKVSKTIVKHHIIKDFSLEIEAKKITAIIGPNGSGKTTLFRLITGLYRPTTGDIERTLPTERCFFLQGNEMLYPILSGKDHLELIAKAYQPKRSIDSVTRLLQIDGFINLKVKTYSLGMKQQLLFAMALLSEAELYVLDEPLNGLDLLVSKQIKQHIKRLIADDKTVIFSTHQLQDVDELADVVHFIKKGVLVEVDNLVDPLTDSYHLQLEKQLTDEEKQRLLACETIKNIKHMSDTEIIVEIEQQTIRLLMAIFSQWNINVLKLTLLAAKTMYNYEAIYGEEAASD